jgi:putative transposase
MSKQITNRAQQGQIIAQTYGSIKRIDEHTYSVKSSSSSARGNRPYNVELTEIGWVCSCLDHRLRGVKCKHIYAIEFNLTSSRGIVSTIH